MGYWSHHKPEKLKNALIKLSRNNLSNLRPHPIYEFFNYSHPTILKRLAFLDKIKKKYENFNPFYLIPTYKKIIKDISKRIKTYEQKNEKRK